MNEESKKNPSRGQQIVIETLASSSKELASLTRKAERVLASLRCGVNDSDDVVQSAARTTLRHQDPDEKDPKRYLRDPLVTSANQVLPLLENHLRRKLNTALAQPAHRHNQAIRAADQKSEIDEFYWRQQFVDHRGERQHEDPDVIESYIADAFATLAELFGEDRTNQVVHDPTTRQAARLLLMGHTRREIAAELNISFHYARRACDQVISVLQSKSLGCQGNDE